MSGAFPDVRAVNIETFRARYKRMFAELMQDDPHIAFEVMAIWQRFDQKMCRLHNIVDTDAIERGALDAFAGAVAELDQI